MKRYILFIWVFLFISCSSDHKKRNCITCYFFFNYDCPAAQKYIYIMNELYRLYDADSICFTGVCTNYSSRFHSKEDIIKKIGLDFNVLTDDKFELCRKYNVHVSPQVVLCDFNDQILYTGSIDDYYFDVGLHKSRVDKYYLRDAIISRIRNIEIKIKETQPYGCILNY